MVEKNLFKGGRSSFSIDDLLARTPISAKSEITNQTPISASPDLSNQNSTLTEPDLKFTLNLSSSFSIHHKDLQQTPSLTQSTAILPSSLTSIPLLSQTASIPHSTLSYFSQPSIPFSTSISPHRSEASIRKISPVSPDTNPHSPLIVSRSTQLPYPSPKSPKNPSSPREDFVLNNKELLAP